MATTSGPKREENALEYSTEAPLKHGSPKTGTKQNSSDVGETVLFQDKAMKKIGSIVAMQEMVPREQC
jgi:hypothetical protein